MKNIQTLFILTLISKVLKPSGGGLPELSKGLPREFLQMDVIEYQLRIIICPN